MRLKIGFSRPRLNRQQFALSEEKQEDEWGCTFSIEQFAKLALSDENDISQLWRGWRGNSGFPRAHSCPALPRCLHTHPLWHCCPCQVSCHLKYFKLEEEGVGGRVGVGVLGLTDWVHQDKSKPLGNGEITSDQIRSVPNGNLHLYG